MLSVTKISAPNEGSDTAQEPAAKSISLSLPAILGRGPLLKCAEVKVSRRHASMDWDDEDSVVIEAVSNIHLLHVSS